MVYLQIHVVGGGAKFVFCMLLHRMCQVTGVQLPQFDGGNFENVALGKDIHRLGVAALVLVDDEGAERVQLGPKIERF